MSRLALPLKALADVLARIGAASTRAAAPRPVRLVAVSKVRPAPAPPLSCPCLTARMPEWPRDE